MKKPLVVANWKMNTSLSDAIILSTRIKNSVDNLEAEIVICPPFAWLLTLKELLEHAPENLHLGAQNMWFADSGAMTGEISPMMLRNIAKYVILGHSERRSHFGESSTLINDKVQAALRHGLKPIMCVSELKKLQDGKRGRGRPTEAYLKSDIIQQVKYGLKGVDNKDIGKVIIAFEPVWAISTTADSKGVASGVYAAGAIDSIREYLSTKYGVEIAKDMVIIYGGSVDSRNVNEILCQEEIDGVLVGSASLKVDEFIKICKIAGGKS